MPRLNTLNSIEFYDVWRGSGMFRGTFGGGSVVVRMGQVFTIKVVFLPLHDSHGEAIDTHAIWKAERGSPKN